MSTELPGQALQLRSLVKEDQTVEAYLELVEVPEPGTGGAHPGRGGAHQPL